MNRRAIEAGDVNRNDYLEQKPLEGRAAERVSKTQDRCMAPSSPAMN
jgi:hypothetical protein